MDVEAFPPDAMIDVFTAAEQPDLWDHARQSFILAMVACARAARLDCLVAPVRPSWKDRYQLIPIDRYAHWKRGDAFSADGEYQSRQRAIWASSSSGSDRAAGGRPAR